MVAEDVIVGQAICILTLNPQGLKPDVLADKILATKPDIIPQPLYHPTKSYHVGQRIFVPQHKDWYTVKSVTSGIIEGKYDHGGVRRLIHQNSKIRVDGVPDTPKQFLIQLIREYLKESKQVVFSQGKWTLAHQNPSTSSKEPLVIKKLKLQTLLGNKELLKSLMISDNSNGFGCL